MFGTKSSTIIKVTENCNFNCLYCLRNVKHSENISIQTLDNYFAKLSTFPLIELSNIWHGGEPLLMTMDFYQEAFNLIKFYFPKAVIKHSFQTNGYLINEKTIRFIKDNKIGVGISIDGPDEINSLRVLKNGQNPFNTIIENIKELRRNKVNYGLLSVVSRKFIGHELQIYEFLRDHSTNARLNFISPAGIGKDFITNSENKLSIEDASLIMQRFYTIWKDDKPKGKSPFILSPFSEIIESFFSGKNKVCELSCSGCCNFLCLGVDGDIYPCGRFSADETFAMGNINTNNFEEIYNSSPAKLRESRIHFIASECTGCKYYHLCNGGCAHQSYSGGNYTMKTPYCEALFNLFFTINSSLKS